MRKVSLGGHLRWMSRPISARQLCGRVCLGMAHCDRWNAGTAACIHVGRDFEEILEFRTQNVGVKAELGRGRDFRLARYSVSHLVNGNASSNVHPWTNSWNRTAKDNICVYLSPNAGETGRFQLRHPCTVPNYYPFVSFHDVFVSSTSVSRIRHKDSKRSPFWAIVCEWFSVYFRFPQSDNAEFTSRTLITDRKTFLNLLRKIQFDSKSYEYCAGEEQRASQASQNNRKKVPPLLLPENLWHRTLFCLIFHVTSPRFVPN